MIIIIWLCLITVSHCQHVDSKVITVSNDGYDSILCCKFGNCSCSSLSHALSQIANNTVINITSPAVSLHTAAHIKILISIKITSNVGATIMCNDTGTVFFALCIDVTIEGIIWDQCGNISMPMTAGITFHISFNIFIINCTFQQFKVCVAVDMFDVLGSINVINSKFMFNSISNASACSEIYYSSLLVLPYGDIDIIIHNSLFYSNGNSDQGSGLLNGSLFVGNAEQTVTQSILVKNTSFVSNGIMSMYIKDGTVKSKTIFDEVNVSDNRYGIYALLAGKLNVISSHLTHNNNGALYLQLHEKVNIKLYNTTFGNNSATSNTLGTALYVFTANDSTINISLCNFYDNFGGNSIVYIYNYLPFDFPSTFSNVLITSSNFVNNKNGPALQVAKCVLNFFSSTLFKDNSAKSGAAIYIAQTSQITVDDGSTVQFINNTASVRGGAMYIDLTNCYNRGIVFTNFTRYDIISFINNSAKLSGNSIYFNIPASCDVVRDYDEIDSAAYVPYKFSYTQSPEIIGSAIVASPYKIQLCSSANCGLTSSSECVIKNDVMLGQFVYFNATICDYFNGAAEATKFQVICINCGFKYRLLDDEILVQNASNDRINLLSVNADKDLKNYTNISLSVSSLLAPEYKELTGTLSLTLSSCNNGYLFSEQSQHCECYNKDGYIKCEGDNVSIKLGYWFGIFAGSHTFSVCHNDFCNFFTHRKETRNGFYNLPEEIDDQCKSHRTGVACGECSKGYTLAYNSPDCLSIEKCSTGMVVLVVVLTALYWIGVIGILFGIAHFLNTRQVPLGYLYGITYFYSIVDILLVTNLHKTDGIFYVTTILSSFAKLNPQFLGRLCFIKNLDAIDQQFIHYCHMVFIVIILIGIYILPKCNKRAFFYVKHCIVQVTCLVLLFAYSSLTSTSLLLLKAVKFDDIDSLYIYLSPHLKYYAQRHAVYASVAILCGLLITIGFPSLLVTEPLMMKMFNDHLNKKAWKIATLRIKFFMKKQNFFVRIKLLLDQLQDCYKDQYRWFAAYYLICRLVIMLITYFANNDYNNMIYYLQTACVIIAMTHIWIQPYKNDVLNVIDAIILLIMLLIVNLSAFSFSTSTIAGIAISLIIAPLLLLFAVGVQKLFVSKIKMFQRKDGNNSSLNLTSVPR